MPKMWYASIRGNVAGPFAASVIRLMAEKGAIGPEDLVRPEGQEEWYIAKSVDGLFDKGEQAVLHANCPGCGVPLAYDSKFLGKRFKCAKCLRVVEISNEGVPRLAATGPAVAHAGKPAAAAHMVKYKCEHCKAVLETASSLAMKEKVCPLCGKVNSVPPTKEQARQQQEREKALLKVSVCVLGCILFILLLISGAVHNDIGRGATLLFGVLTAYMAYRKGLNPWYWLLSGGLVGLFYLQCWYDWRERERHGIALGIKDNIMGFVLSIIVIQWVILSAVLSFTMKGK